MANEHDIPQLKNMEDNVPQTSPTLTMLYLLWHNRRFLGLSAAIGFVLSVILAFIIPKEYKSTVQLMPPDSQSSGAASLAAFAGAALPSALAGQASSLLGTKTPTATFQVILSSRTVQDDLINRFDLRKIYHCKYYEDARKKLTRRTTVDEDKKSGNLTITVTDNDPVRARDMTAAYVSELDKLVVQMSTSSARRERIFLESRIASVKQDLDSATRDLSQFSSQNATLNPEIQGRATLEAAEKLQGEVISAQSELHGLETMYSAENIRVRVAHARVDELQRKLNELSGTETDRASNTGSDQPYPSMRKLPILGVAYTDLYRRAMIQEALYAMLVKQYEAAKVQEAKDVPFVKILDPPNLAEKKSFPPRSLIAIGGTILALVFAAIWLISNRYWISLAENNPSKQFMREVYATALLAFLRRGASGGNHKPA
jgi:capsule polysaccharide export protein KpsE/RkpR